MGLRSKVLGYKLSTLPRCQGFSAEEFIAARIDRSMPVVVIAPKGSVVREDVQPDRAGQGARRAGRGPAAQPGEERDGGVRA